MDFTDLLSCLFFLSQFKLAVFEYCSVSEFGSFLKKKKKSSPSQNELFPSVVFGQPGWEPE